MNETEERMEAHDRTERYYEIMGYDIPDHYSDEYRERFYENLRKIQDER